MRLALADLGRERDRIEALEQPDLGEELSHQRRRVEGVRDQADREPSRAQRVDQLEHRWLEVMRRAPHPVLGHDEAAHSVIVPACAERAEERRDLGRVVDLVLPLADEEWQQLPAVGVGEVRLRGRSGAEGGEAANMPLDEQLRIEFPGDQGVAPVEEDCPDHRGG